MEREGEMHFHKYKCRYWFSPATAFLFPELPDEHYLMWHGVNLFWVSVFLDIFTTQANLAQLVEHFIRNERVVGSSPIVGSICIAGIITGNCFFV